MNRTKMVDRGLEDEVSALGRQQTAIRADITANSQGIAAINASLRQVLDRLDALSAQGAAGGAPADGRAYAEAGAAFGGQQGGGEERALRDMRRSLATIPRFSGDRAGPTFRQHVETVRTHNCVYAVTEPTIAKSGLLMSLTGSAATRASGAGIRSPAFSDTSNFEEYAAALLSIFEPDSEKMLARADFMAYKQAATEDVGSYLAVKNDLHRQAFPGTTLNDDDSAFVSYHREVVSGLYSRVIKRLVIRSNPKTVEALKTACLEAVSAERANYDLGCAESLNLDGLASVTRGHQRRRNEEAMEINQVRPSKDMTVTCGFCSIKGHRTSECRKRQKQLENSKPSKQGERRRETGGRDKPKDTRTCRACNKSGHLESNCWAKHGKPKKGAVNSATTQPDEEFIEDEWDWAGPVPLDGDINHLQPFLGQWGRRSRE